jgi:hypothetical protein
MRSPPDWGLVYTTVEFIKYCVCFIGPRLFIDWQAVESSPRYRIPLIKDPENGSVGAIVLGKERGPFRLPHGRNWPEVLLVRDAPCFVISARAKGKTAFEKCLADLILIKYRDRRVDMPFTRRTSISRRDDINLC